MSDRILVTGGSGFLGSALVRRLVRAGHDVVVLDDNSRGSLLRLEDIREELTFIVGDIRDADAVVAAAVGCHSIFHLAFVNGTKFFYEKPDLVLDVGVKGALNTLEAVRKCGVETYVLASSSEIYQQPENIPTPESARAIIPDVRNPRFSYAGGKLISELLSINFLRDTGVRDMIFRPHNVFGPNMGFEHVIPEMMQKIFAATDGWNKSDAEIQIQGTGEETRAFCFVEDAVDQLIALYDNGAKGEIYHIGIDNEVTIRELIEYMASILGINISIIPGSIRKGGTSRRCPDISKIRNLGYSRQDHFAEGLAETVSWYKNYYAEQPAQTALRTVVGN